MPVETEKILVAVASTSPHKVGAVKREFKKLCQNQN